MDGIITKKIKNCFKNHVFITSGSTSNNTAKEPEVRQKIFVYAYKIVDKYPRLLDVSVINNIFKLKH